MRLSLLLYLVTLLLGPVNCMKRSYAQISRGKGHMNVTTRSVKQKVCSQTLEAINEEELWVIMVDDPELFLAVYQIETSDLPTATFSPRDLKVLLLSIIDLGQVRVLERVLTRREFRQAISEEHWRKALTECHPDVLACMVNAPFEEDEERWVDYCDDLRSLPTLLACGYAKCKIALPFMRLTHFDLIDASYSPSILSITCEKFLSQFGSMSEDEKFIFYLTVQYTSSVHLAFKTYCTDRKPIAKLLFIVQLENLLAFFQARNLDAIANHLKDEEGILIQSSKQMIIALHMALHFGFPEAFKFINTQSSLSCGILRKVAALSLTALRSNAQRPDLKLFNRFCKFMPFNRFMFQSLVESTLDELIDSGDLTSILNLLPSWPFGKQSFKPRRRSVAIRLAESAKSGDWRNIMVFSDWRNIMVFKSKLYTAG